MPGRGMTADKFARRLDRNHARVYLHCRHGRGFAVEGKVQRWGNSLAVRIPKAFASQARLSVDGAVDISLDGNKLIIKAAPRRSPVLADLLARITPENIHEEIDFGPAVGKETW